MITTQTYSAYWQERLKPTIDTQVDIHDINKGKPLLRIPRQFLQDTNDFVNYIHETAKKTFQVKGHYTKTGEITEKIIPYIHRWTAPYRKSIMAKLYLLQDYFGQDLKDVEFITLTIPHRDLDQEETLLTLNTYRQKLFWVLTKLLGTQDYFYILEPHKSGHAHIHILYFKKLTKEQKEHVKTLWANKYCNGAKGAKEHGLYFSEPRASKNGVFREGSIAHIKGYVMKYVVKNLSDADGGISRMKPNEILFNALLKKHKIRLWNASRNLSKVMARPKVERKEDWECDVVNMRYDEEFQANVWKREEKIESDTCGVCTENNFWADDDDEGSVFVRQDPVKPYITLSDRLKIRNKCIKELLI